MEDCKTPVTDSYLDFIQPYIGAMELFLARLEALKELFTDSKGQDTVHHIESRIKTQESIEGKLRQMGLIVSESFPAQSASLLRDVAGVRIVCYDRSGVDRIASLLKSKLDFTICKERDYIRNPKPSGYRSLHLVFAVPVCGKCGPGLYPVELQLRTLGMDFWASLEHRQCYKNITHDSVDSGTKAPNTEAEFALYSQVIEAIEERMT